MSKQSNLSPKKVSKIAGLLKAGNMSQYKISDISCISHSSVKEF